MKNFSPLSSSDGSQELIARWCLLRAIEWRHFPFFIGQLIAPIALIFFPWLQVAIALVIVSSFWSFICLSVVNLRIAHFGSILVQLKWPLGMGAAIYLALDKQYVNASIALLWPIFTLLLTWLVPSVSTGEAEVAFINKIMSGAGDA